MEHKITVAGTWQFQWENEVFHVPALQKISVADEKYEALPVYQERQGWTDGVVLRGLVAAECSLANALLPESVVVKFPDGTVLKRGEDYEFSDQWAAIGRLENGTIAPDAEIWISYCYIPLRLDSVIRSADGSLGYKSGTGASATPALPELADGEFRLLNIFLEPGTTHLTREMLFPILEQELKVPAATAQQLFIPETMAKLRNGGKVKILAWGDSVTEGSYLPEADRWPQQFVARLRKCFPQAQIELVSHGWPGKTIPAFLAEPSGSPYNYEETVLAVQPDLVISEFVNDAGLEPAEWSRAFPKILQDFRQRGYEWIILTPHYVRPDWMGLSSQNGEAIENDPRPYVRYLRDFARDQQVALADAAMLYGRLWRCGLPYNTMMTNNINHPDKRGMKLFADALMAIFEH